MLNSKKDRNPKKDRWFDSHDISGSSGVYFYLIILVSLLLPVVVAGGVMFTDLVVTGIITAMLLALLGLLIRIYMKLKRELREFDETMDRLHLLEGDCEISMLGGLLNIRIEEHKGRSHEIPQLPGSCGSHEPN